MGYTFNSKYLFFLCSNRIHHLIKYFFKITFLSHQICSEFLYPQVWTMKSRNFLVEGKLINETRLSNKSHPVPFTLSTSFGHLCCLARYEKRAGAPRARRPHLNKSRDVRMWRRCASFDITSWCASAIDMCHKVATHTWLRTWHTI